MTESTETVLAAPGAGLPKPELFVARRLFGLRCRRGNEDSLVADFRAEQDGVRQLVDSCPERQRGERILIRRLRGLEDSSRNYSVWMTLDHLRLVNSGLARIIADLGAGREPAGTVSTADVKPDPGVDSTIEESHEQACAEFLDAVVKVPELRTERRHAHPWFGPLDAHGWLALAGMHMGIHRRQIAAILRGLPG